MDEGPTGIDRHRAAIDRLIPVAGLGVLLVGWSFGRGRGRRQLMLTGPEGAIADLLESAERFVRFDLLRTFGDDIGDAHETAGFATFLRLGPDKTPRSCAVVHEGTVIRHTSLPEPQTEIDGSRLPGLLATFLKSRDRARAALRRFLPDLADSLDPPEVEGRLDRLGEDLAVSGWAAIEGQEGPAEVEVAVNGATVARRSATMRRWDGGGGRNGFRIALPPSTITRLVNDIAVSVAGMPLDNSPTRLSLAGRLSARLEGIANGKLRIRLDGWPGERIGGRVLVDGREAGQVTLEAPAEPAGSGASAHAAGAWPLPEALRDGRPHVYAFEIRDRDTVVRTDAAVLRCPDYTLRVERATRQRIAGWAVRTDRPKPLSLAVLADGRVVGEGTACLSRGDVRDHHGFATAECGFDIALAGLPAGPETRLVLRDAETGIDLADIALADRYEALAAIARAAAGAPGDAGAPGLEAVLGPLIERSGPETAFSFTPLPRRPAPSPDTRRIGVVIPVYGGAIETAECLESVLSARNETPARIFLVNDNTPDRTIRDLLDAPRIRAREDVTVIHRTRNGGFSESVNRGMIAAGDDDVILLNADTEVQDGWIDRIVRAADSDPRIATVTPLSNNGEIVTVPYACKSLPVETPELAASVDAAAARLNGGVVVDLPVAIGFCMFIRRRALDEIGLFDAELWGRGYGEEVDFCIKARARGWRHVLDASTFVVHRGSVSFGDEKLERIRESAKKISERYPFYDAHIQRFLAADPVEPPRRALNLELIDGALGADRVLHVTHAYGGGTERYVTDLASEQRGEGRVPLVLRVGSDGTARLEIDLAGTALEGFFRRRHVETFAPSETEALEAAVARLAPAGLHLHAPFGLPRALLDRLTAAHPYEVTVHDYSWICPRVTLTLPGARYCGEPEVETCESCVLFNGAHHGLARLVAEHGGSVAAYRAHLSGIVTGATAVRTASQDVIERLSAHGMAEAPFVRGPYPGAETALPDPAAVAARRPRRAGPARIALFGGISDVKGYERLLACAAHCAEHRIAAEFVVFGYTPDPARTRAAGPVFETGRYREADLPALVEEHEPDVAFFPNRWPETYSYTLSHAFRLGLWPVVTDIGAPAERVRETGFGTVLSLEAEPAETVRILLDLARRGRERA